MHRPLVVIGLVGAQVLAPTASGQVEPTVVIGRIESEQTCTVYQQSAGRMGFVATRNAVAAVASWRTWLERDCIDNFAGIRTALEAAVAASGGVAVRTSGGRFTVSGRISEVSGDDGPDPDVPDVGTQGHARSSRQMRVVMDVTVRGPGGALVFGVPLVKSIETAYDVQGNGYRTGAREDGRAVYARLQQEVALAVARAVAFHFAPLMVTAAEGRQIRLNYGGPLLKLGTIVRATSRDGFATLRYVVTSAQSGQATARLDGSGDPMRIRPGDRASVIESDDPAANGRRFERVDLP